MAVLRPPPPPPIVLRPPNNMALRLNHTVPRSSNHMVLRNISNTAPRLNHMVPRNSSYMGRLDNTRPVSRQAIVVPSLIPHAQAPMGSHNRMVNSPSKAATRHRARVDIRHRVQEDSTRAGHRRRARTRRMPNMVRRHRNLRGKPGGFVGRL